MIISGGGVRVVSEFSSLAHKMGEWRNILILESAFHLNAKHNNLSQIVRIDFDPKLFLLWPVVNVEYVLWWSVVDKFN